MHNVTYPTNYQQELLKIIPPDISSDDVNAIRRFLVKYFAEKATQEANKFWEEKGFKSAKDMEKYLDE